MSLLGPIKNRKSQNQEFDKESTLITIDNGIIPYEKFINEDKIKLIVLDKNEEKIARICKEIAKYQNKHREKDITVIISSSYKKIHEITRGAI